MKTWKKRWKEELSAVMPSLSEEVKNAPIVLSEEKEKGELKKEEEPKEKRGVENLNQASYPSRSFPIVSFNLCYILRFNCAYHHLITHLSLCSTEHFVHL